MAKNDDSILRHEENGVEYFTVKATGESGLSEIGLSRLTGIPQQTLNRWLTDLTQNKPVKGLESLQGKSLYLTQTATKRGGKVKIVKSGIVYEILEFAAFEHGSKVARQTLKACGNIGVESFIQGKTGWLPKDKQSSKEARDRINRILFKGNPWERFYEKEMCDKVRSWYGFDCAKFYWWYTYSWMSPEERDRLNFANPIEKKGKRIARKRKVHQHIDAATKERLSEYVEYLWKCIEFSDSRMEFERKWARKYGQPEQLELFDLWDFVD